MRDKGLGVAIAFGLIIFVLVWAQTNGFASQPVASTDVVVRQVPPTVDDDIDRGFLPGFVWVDQTNTNVYIAITTADGAANWNQIDVLTASLGSEYGNLYADDAATGAQVLATAGTFEVITAFDKEGTSTADTTINTGANTITIGTAGDYLINFSVSYSGVANKEYDIAVFIDDVKVDESQTHRTLGSGGAVGVVAGVGIIASITAGQVIDLRAAPETNGNQVTVIHGSLAVVELPSS